MENNIGLFEKSPENIIENPHYKFLEKKVLYREFSEAKSELEFKKNCIQGPYGHCIMLFLNGEINKKKKIPNLKYIKNLSFMNKLILEDPFNKYYQFRNINATCHTELANSFKISKEKLPAIVYLNTQYGQYESFSDEFVEENILEFFDKIKNKRFQNNKIELKDVKFDFKNCEEIFTPMENIDYEKLERIKYGLEDEEFEEEANIPEKDEI